LHQVGDLFELNVKLWCQKFKVVIAASETHRNNTTQRTEWEHISNYHSYSQWKNV
jgi:hypothetical protein